MKSKITEVTELLYQQKITEAYGLLPTILAEFSNYVVTVEDSAQQQKILETLNEALGAMEQQDTTLLADILQYELVDCM